MIVGLKTTNNFIFTLYMLFAFCKRLFSIYASVALVQIDIKYSNRDFLVRLVFIRDV